MKKNLLLLILVVVAGIAVAQSPVPNGNFENWTPGTYNYPKYYPFNSNNEAFLRYNLPFNLIRTTDAYHGTYAMRLTTLASSLDTLIGYAVNSDIGDKAVWHGGVPYTEIPTGITGYFKYNIAGPDSAVIVVAFSKAGTNTGMYIYKIGGIFASYTPLRFTFVPALTQAPDSVIFGVASSNFSSSTYTPGSTLFVDSVSFTGAVTQPALLNGDFETWESATQYKLNNWFTDQQGMERTTDSYAGLYAVKLTTYVGSDKGVPVAREGMISTGWYSDACHCMKGGYPFTNKKDTIVFYYKYTPKISTDSALIMYSIKKAGSYINGGGIKLEASASYKYVEYPIENFVTPDSVIFDIRSSLYTNKSTSYAGAVLTIDEINFKSQLITSGVNDFKNPVEAKIYPNPSSGHLTVLLPEIKGGTGYRKIEIYGVTGQKVLESIVSEQSTELDISKLPDGIYYIRETGERSGKTYKIVKH